MNGARFLALHVGVLAVFAAGTWAAGSVVLRLALRAGADSGARRSAIIAPILGLAVLAWAGALLGLFGLLARPALVALLALVLVAACAARRSGQRSAAAASRASAQPVAWPGRGALAGAAAIVGLPLFVLALYPPTAFDETLYHLPYARAFVDCGCLPFLPELRFPVFPQLSEVLQAALLTFAGDAATHFVSLLAVALTAALLWVWGQDGGGGERPWVGALAAAIWLGNPLVAYLAATSYIEPLLALFVTAALYAHWRWGSSNGGLIVAGLLSGAAAGTKYLGLYFVAALGVSTLLARHGHSRSWPRRLRDGCLFAAAALLALAPWYGHIVALTGNPVFPFLSGIFGANEWTQSHFHVLAPPAGTGEWIAGLGRGARNLLTSPWDAVVRRERVGGLPPLSPIYLLALPLLAFSIWRRRPASGLGRLLLVVLPFLLLFLLLPADVRYLLAPLPVLGFGLALALADAIAWLGERRPEAQSRPSRSIVVLLVGLLALPGTLYAVHRLVLQGPVPVTLAQRDVHLRRMLPYYPAMARVNELARPGDTVYGLHLEAMRYLARPRFLGDWFGPHRFGLLLARLDEPEAFRDQLRAWQVDYLAVARSSPAGERLASGEFGLELLFEDSAALVYAVRPRHEGGLR